MVSWYEDNVTYSKPACFKNISGKWLLQVDQTTALQDVEIVKTTINIGIKIVVLGNE